jgi:hypothetical protein
LKCLAMACRAGLATQGPRSRPSGVTLIRPCASDNVRHSTNFAFGAAILAQESLLKNTTNRSPRDFVVEYKSNRRRPKVGVKSIWGDTNLKALAQDVADDMPPLTSLRNATEIESKSSQESSAKDGKVQTPEPVSITAPVAPAPAVTQAAELPVHQVEVPKGSASGSKPKSKREPKRVQRTAVRTRTPLASGSKSLVDSQSSDIVSADCDILSILEMENRRLKLLLAAKLQLENAQLRVMLQRFDT